ncbi:AAA family ATPase [Bacillus cereus group sp. N21]|uniref:AAA family ATPase n=1 Tax=Bacillus cereus group sp. N21 TaxID=2794591 RepID=UPI0018F68FDE|nr:AAA family ATPase [Bacillus cereus group sp. N21]MBJ8030244.1 AAA family ATPase [Bacillus cereus group sp. N21]
MSEKLFLEKLTLVGFRKNYEVEFKKGLNFISGPMSTGKSSIAEMINYSLGSKKHKAYIEIGKSCKEVQLDFWIGEKKFKVVRPLFDFKRPVKLFRWNNEEDDFEKHFDLLEIDSPANKQSLSAFLLNEIGLLDIIVANQNFSFRDLFKYSYVKQSIIDSENLLMEKTSGSNLKRKPTFEIIFNIYNELLGDLKQQLKEKLKLIDFLNNKRLGVYEFLKEMNMLSDKTFQEEKERLNKLLSIETNKLREIKASGTYDKSLTMGIEGEISELKEKINKFDTFILDKEKHIDKLFFLRNQYSGEIQKIEFILEGSLILNSYTFDLCPSCLNSINHKTGCTLCGSELKDLSVEETKIFKSELLRLTKKLNNLIKFIDQQRKGLMVIQKQREASEKELHVKQRELDHLINHYMSPYIEQIQQINYEIGKINSSLDQLERNISVVGQFSKITEKILEEEKLRDNLQKRISALEKNTMTKKDVIQNLSKLFSGILEEFSFPKLSNAFIEESNYLPYVRGVKYDELGSGGALTMTTMAYFLSIALLKTKNKNHLGLLIIDSPRKNLGADSEIDDEFKDEEIFNSIIKYFVSLKDKKDKTEDPVEDIQLIVINNGHPDFLSEDDLIVKFDGKGTGQLPYGLIDDVENL